MVAYPKTILPSRATSECDGHIYADGSEGDDDHGPDHRETRNPFQEYHWSVWKSLYFHERFFYRDMGTGYRMSQLCNADAPTACRQYRLRGLSCMARIFLSSSRSATTCSATP